MLYELSENITNEMLQEIVFLLRNHLPKRHRITVCGKSGKYACGGEGRRSEWEWNGRRSVRSLWQKRWCVTKLVNVHRVSKEEALSLCDVKLTVWTVLIGSKADDRLLETIRAETNGFKFKS